MHFFVDSFISYYYRLTSCFSPQLHYFPSSHPLSLASASVPCVSEMYSWHPLRLLGFHLRCFSINHSLKVWTIILLKSGQSIPKCPYYHSLNVRTIIPKKVQIIIPKRPNFHSLKVRTTVPSIYGKSYFTDFQLFKVENNGPIILKGLKNYLKLKMKFKCSKFAPHKNVNVILTL